MRPWVVMKFGGTSVGSADAMRVMASHVAREERRPFVVVSAMGGITDLLLKAAEISRSGGDWRSVAGIVSSRHVECARALGADEAPIAACAEEMDRLLTGISMLGELTPRVADAVLSIGERTSVHLAAAAIRGAGRAAKAWAAWDLGLITDGNHGRAEPGPTHPEDIARAVAASVGGGEVPVVTGFLGKSAAGDVTTLGRGGSDFSASVFGASIGAEEIQIWTDVAGMMRADPRVVPGAEVVPEVTFEEAAELAYFGAKVLHPRTVEPARRRGIPVRVLGTFHVDPTSGIGVSRQGTVIRPRAPAEPARAIALQREVRALHVQSTRMLDAHGFLARVFRIMADHSISVNVIATSEVSISMTIDREGGDLEAAAREIGEFADVERVPARALICVVGSGLRQDTSLLGLIFRILGEAGVTVHVISQGASRINITLATDPSDGPVAVRALHDGLFGGERQRA